MLAAHPESYIRIKTYDKNLLSNPPLFRGLKINVFHIFNSHLVIYSDTRSTSYNVKLNLNILIMYNIKYKFAGPVTVFHDLVN